VGGGGPEGSLWAAPTAEALTLASVATLEPVPPPASSRETRWTVDKDQSLGELCSLWGLRTERIRTLNPELQGRTDVRAGETFVVYRPDPRDRTESFGAPNKGRLHNGMPLPEGDGWEIRRRRRGYGTRTTVESLVDAFNAYRRAQPESPALRIGELSARSGGRAQPHSSHRSGRDVDLAYVTVDPTSRPSPKNFDTARNFALIQSLVATGRVQQIYVANGLQAKMRKHAAKFLSPAELAVYFRDPHGPADQRPLLKHWDGHRDHMHVRFECGPEEPHCRPDSVE
jgi:murein endopeptidase